MNRNSNFSGSAIGGFWNVTHLKVTIATICIFVVSLIGAASVSAKTHYVDATLKSDCVDGQYNLDSRSCNGSNGNAYNTLQKAVNVAQPDDTILVRGAVWSENDIVISDKAANLTIKAYSGEKPVIDNNTPDGSVNEYAKIIYIKDTEGVIIDGLELREWSTGLYIHNSSNCTVRNVVISKMYGAVLQVINSPHTLIEDNEFSNGVYKRYLWNQARDSKYKAPWAGMIGFKYGSNDSIIRRNVIRDSYWEGLDIGRCLKNVLVEYNEIYGNSQLQLYILNNRNNTIRYNMIYGTERPDYEPKPGFRPGGYGQGIWLSMEDHPECSSSEFDGWHKVYGNLVANTKINFWVNTQKDTSGQFYPINGIEVYNNTFIGGRKQNINFASQVGSNHVFKNNIIWANGDGVITNAIPSGKVSADYNLWSSAPDPDIIGPHDPPYGPPQLRKTIGWDKLESGELRSSDFAINGISPGVNNGLALQQTYKDILDVDQSDFNTKSFILKDQTTSGDGWEIGADVFLIDPPVLKIKKSPTG